MSLREPWKLTSGLIDVPITPGHTQLILMLSLEYLGWCQSNSEVGADRLRTYVNGIATGHTYHGGFGSTV